MQPRRTGARSQSISLRSPRSLRLVQLLLCVLTLLSMIARDGARGQGAGARPYTTWRDYGGSADSMQYSALDQINRVNVKRLERAWFHPVPGDADRLPFNPLVMDEVMYVAGTKSAVVAFDAATGKELWTSTERATERGLAYWESKDRSDRRLGIMKVYDRSSPIMRPSQVGSRKYEVGI